MTREWHLILRHTLPHNTLLGVYSVRCTAPVRMCTNNNLVGVVCPVLGWSSTSCVQQELGPSMWQLPVYKPS